MCVSQHAHKFCSKSIELVFKAGVLFHCCSSKGACQDVYSHMHSVPFVPSGVTGMSSVPWRSCGCS